MTHDPLGLTAPGVVVARFEAEAQEQGEDIIQAVCESRGEKRRIADLGWLRDRYMVLLVESEDWESPLQRIECRDLASAVAAFEGLCRHKPNA